MSFDPLVGMSLFHTAALVVPGALVWGVESLFAPAKKSAVRARKRRKGARPVKRRSAPPNADHRRFVRALS